MIKYDTEKRQFFTSAAMTNRRCKTLRPVKSFFSPVKGIPAGTILTLTGDMLVAISTRDAAPAAMPRIRVEIGARWGRNMKGTDWITLARLRRNTLGLAPESGRAHSPRKPSPKTREALRAIARFAPPVHPAS